jgi:hypothetical protein
MQEDGGLRQRSEAPGAEHARLTIGPRVLADIRRRVHELEGRFRPSPGDLRKLAKLKEFLRLAATGGRE